MVRFDPASLARSTSFIDASSTKKSKPKVTTDTGGDEASGTEETTNGPSPDAGTSRNALNGALANERRQAALFQSKVGPKASSLQTEVLGDGEAGNQAFLEPAGREIVHAGVEELAVVLPGEVGAAQMNRPAGQGQQAGTRSQQRPLTAALHSGQPDHLTGSGLYAGPQQITVYYQRIADDSFLEYDCPAELWYRALDGETW